MSTVFLRWNTSFMPLVISTSGGMAKQCTTIYRRLASLLADKWDWPTVCHYDSYTVLYHFLCYEQPSCVFEVPAPPRPRNQAGFSHGLVNQGSSASSELTISFMRAKRVHAGEVDKNFVLSRMPVGGIYFFIYNMPLVLLKK